MKKKDFLLISILSLFLFSLILAGSSLYLINNIGFYKNEFTKYDVYSKFENKSYVYEISINLLNYFNNDTSLLEIYTEKEATHLNDVKNIIFNLKIFFYFGLVLFFVLCSILLFRKYNYSGLVFISASVLVIFFILIFYLFSLFNFSYLFDSFHRILFSNNFWILDENTILIKLFPQEFFIDAFKKIILYIFLISVFCFSFGFYFHKKQFKT